jgi:hypothetical protein
MRSMNGEPCMTRLDGERIMSSAVRAAGMCAQISYSIEDSRQAAENLLQVIRNDRSRTKS